MDKLVKVLNDIFILITNLAKIADKLIKGEIAPEQVDIKDWITKLEELDDLPTA